MMPIATNNRAMFTRVLRRLLFANRGRLFVILLALSAGAAVSAALLNLQTDAKRRLTTEFRAFGPNILVVPAASDSSSTKTMPEVPSANLAPPIDAGVVIHSAEFLYGMAAAGPNALSASSAVVVVGANGQLPGSAPVDSLTESNCLAGQLVAAQLKIAPGDALNLRSGDRNLACKLTSILKTGGPEDGQIFASLSNAQSLLNLPGQISVIQINASGTAAQIEQYTQQLGGKLKGVEIRPLRQFSEAQARIYSRISGLLTAATALILTLTIFCVMAAMTNIAAERRNDVGMMKAIGGSARSVLNLFLTEAVVLGFAGGLIGAAVGIVLSVLLGKAVFGVAAAPRLIVYPISVTLTVIVAILGAYPLRRLVNIRPATVFRGEA
jgi:putative ABC transport system permease protein